MELLIVVTLSYLLGSLSGSILLGKIKGIDIRKMGSNNAGGTNAFRTMGINFAICVLIIDILKGYIAVKYLPLIVLGENSLTYNQNIEIFSLFSGIAVAIGHVYPIYFNFQGGKGAGTLVGVLFALSPISLIICFILWIITLTLTGYVGLSTIVASIILPISEFYIYPGKIDTYFSLFTILIPIFIIYTHRSNIIRMIKGNENRFKKIMIFHKKS